MRAVKLTKAVCSHRCVTCLPSLHVPTPQTGRTVKRGPICPWSSGASDVVDRPAPVPFIEVCLSKHMLDRVLHLSQLRLLKIDKIIETIEETFMIQASALVFVKTVLMLIVGSHFNACFFCWVARMQASVLVYTRTAAPFTQLRSPARSLAIVARPFRS